jgi:hypothetical protein
VPVLEPASWSIRAVAKPAALDAARWHGDAIHVLRIAPDEALAIGASGVEIDGDPSAIVEPEAGFSIDIIGGEDVETLAAHAEWSIPHEPGTLAQGKVAGVPIKLLLLDPIGALIVVQTCYVLELEERLGWR